MWLLLPSPCHPPAQLQGTEMLAAVWVLAGWLAGWLMSPFLSPSFPPRLIYFILQSPQPRCDPDRLRSVGIEAWRYIFSQATWLAPGPSREQRSTHLFQGHDAHSLIRPLSGRGWGGGRQGWPLPGPGLSHTPGLSHGPCLSQARENITLGHSHPVQFIY